MKAIRFENNVPVYLKSTIDIYGFPDYYGITDYLVVADTESPMVSDYQFEQDRRTRPIHRYCRVERFTYTLSQILGLRCVVPDRVMYIVDQCFTFDDIRKVLKKNGFQKYYNSIPSIMIKLGLPPPIKIAMTNELFHLMVDEFKKIQALYDATLFTRKYFPSLRYIAVKILLMNGAEVDIVPIRTKRKLKVLEELWVQL